MDTGLDASKAGEFLGHKLANAITKLNDEKIVKSNENLRNIEEIIISPEKKDEILNKLKKVF